MQVRTLSWWRTQRTHIDMDPPFQRRGRLWSGVETAYLVDSILNGYDIPKLYMADFTWGKSPLNKKKLRYAIIDGKQRLEAIFDFYDGLVVLNDDFKLLSAPKLSLGGLGYKDLIDQYPRVADVFDQYNLLVMGVVANSEERINELFVRLNRSKPLTGAEIRNAMAGPAPSVIRQISRHEFFKDNIGFAASRGQDQNAAAKLLLFEYHDALQETKKLNLDAFVKDASKQPRSKVELAGRKVVDLLDEMQGIFLPRDRLLLSAGQVPIFYWFTRARKAAEYPLIREFLVRSRRSEPTIAPSSRAIPTIDRSTRRSSSSISSKTRNTNDLASHQGRTQILEARFKDFQKRPVLKP